MNETQEIAAFNAVITTLTKTWTDEFDYPFNLDSDDVVLFTKLFTNTETVSDETKINDLYKMCFDYKYLKEICVKFIDVKKLEKIRRGVY